MFKYFFLCITNFYDHRKLLKKEKNYMIKVKILSNIRLRNNYGVNDIEIFDKL